MASAVSKDGLQVWWCYTARRKTQDAADVMEESCGTTSTIQRRCFRDILQCVGCDAAPDRSTGKHDMRRLMMRKRCTAGPHFNLSWPSEQWVAGAVNPQGWQSGKTQSQHRKKLTMWWQMTNITIGTTELTNIFSVAPQPCKRRIKVYMHECTLYFYLFLSYCITVDQGPVSWNWCYKVRVGRYISATQN